MKIKCLAYAWATAATFGIGAVADAAPATREPLSSTATATQLRTRLDSGIAEWRAARPRAKAALARSRLVGAPRIEGVLTRLDDIVGRLNKQLTSRRLTSAQLAEMTEQLQSEEEKWKEEMNKAREEAKAGFRDTDEQVNQLLNVLTGITQTMNEMRAGGCKGCM